MANKASETKKVTSKRVTKEELRTEINALVKEYNEANQDEKFDRAYALDEEIQNKVGEYAGIARSDCFLELCKTEDPMLSAVKQLTYTVLRIKDTKTGEGEKKIPVRKVVDAIRPIDLLALHKYRGGDGIGKDPKWNNFVEAFNKAMTAWVGVTIGVPLKDLDDSYAMSEISRSIDMGKTPTSNTQLLKNMQSVVNAMLGGEYKATSHHIESLKVIYAKLDKRKLTAISCPGHPEFCLNMMVICHCIVTGKKFEVVYKTVKSK